MGIVKVAEKCPDLQLLDMSYCYHLSNESLKALSRHSKSLVHLGINGISRVTKEWIQEVAKRCTKLKFLEFRFCSGLPDPFRSPQSLAEYEEFSKNLKVVSLRASIVSFYASQDHVYRV